jgi:hypothetical protein
MKVRIATYLKELNDIRVPYLLQYCYFSVDSVKISVVLYFVFFENFDGHLTR